MHANETSKPIQSHTKSKHLTQLGTPRKSSTQDPKSFLAVSETTPKLSSKTLAYKEFPSNRVQRTDTTRGHHKNSTNVPHRDHKKENGNVNNNNNKCIGDKNASCDSVDDILNMFEPRVLEIKSKSIDLRTAIVSFLHSNI